MDNKIWIISIIAVFTIIAVIFGVSMNTIERCYKSETSDNMICVSHRSDNFFTTLIYPESQSGTSNEVKPNEEVAIKTIFDSGWYSPTDCSAIGSAKIVLWNPDDRLLERWDVTSSFSGGDCTYWRFKAPETWVNFRGSDETGRYRVNVVLKDQDLKNTVYSEAAYFTIVEPECEEESDVSSWDKYQEDETRVVKKRVITEVSDYPECDVDVDNEYKTECKSGYVIQGLDTSVADGVKNCEEEQDEITCYKCKDGEVITQKMVSCENGWSETKPECSPELVTCYRCVDGIIETQEFLTCEDEWSETEPECENLICTTEYDPVCGVDGNTYSNSCFAEKSGVEIDYEGACEDDDDNDIITVTCYNCINNELVVDEYENTCPDDWSSEQIQCVDNNQDDKETKSWFVSIWEWFKGFFS